jgi:hypothetical protein
MKIWVKALPGSAAFIFETGADFKTLDGDGLNLRRNS